MCSKDVASEEVVAGATLSRHVDNAKIKMFNISVSDWECSGVVTEKRRQLQSTNPYTRFKKNYLTNRYTTLALGKICN
jgi:hypothetical protein